MKHLDDILSQYRTTKATTVRMTQDMRDKIDQISFETHGSRGFTRWTEDAVASFTELPDAVLKVGAGEADAEFSAVKYVRLTRVSEEYIRDLAGKIHWVDPLVHNARSLILRAAYRHAIREYLKKGRRQGEEEEA